MTTTEKREDAHSAPEGAPFTPEVKALLAKIRRSMAKSSLTVDDYLEAKHAGVDAENAAMKRLAAARRRAAKRRRPAKAGERRKLVDSIMGKYAWVPYSSEDFNRDKRREIALENRA